MGNDERWTGGQALQTLTIIGQQEPTVGHLNTLRAGYLAHLMQAIKRGTLHSLEEFDQAIELSVLRPDRAILSPSCKEFRVADHFVVDFSTSARVRIGEIDQTFQQCILPKTEKNILLARLASFHLGAMERRHGETYVSIWSSDILQKLGGKKGAVVPVASIWNLLSRQPNGESGTIDTSGCAVHFFVESIDSNVLEVRLRWLSEKEYWCVQAYSTTQTEWFTGSQVFSLAS